MTKFRKILLSALAAIIVGAGFGLHALADNPSFWCQFSGTAILKPCTGTPSVQTTNSSTTNFTLLGPLYDSTGSKGSNTQLLKSTGSATQWVNASYVSLTRNVNTNSPLQGGGALSGDLTLSIPQASTTGSGYLSSTDWNTFNNKQGALSFPLTVSQGGTNTTTLGSLTSGSSPNLTVTGGQSVLIGTSTQINLGSNVVTGVATGSSGSVLNANISTNTLTINLPYSSSSNDGQLSHTDWSTFNGKQPAGNYITALTGDVTASGPGSAASTLATVNTNVGTYGNASTVPVVTVNGKGLVTGMSTSSIYSAFSASNPITFNNSTGAIGWTNSNNYITLGSLSGTAPITYNNGTGAIGITLPLTAAQGGTATTTAPSQTGQILAADGTGTKYGPATLVNTTYTSWATSTPGQLSVTISGLQPTITNPVTGTGTATQCAFWATSSSISSDSNCYWDNVNKALGIGGTPGSEILYVGGKTGINTTTGASTLTLVGSGGINPLTVASSTGTALVTVTQAGNVGIGTTSPSGKLDVYGNVVITNSGLLQFGGTSSSFFAIKPGASGLNIRTADDTNYGNMRVASLILGNGSTLSDTSSGVARLTNGAGTDFTRLQFGGTTSAFPAINSINTSTGAQNALQVIGADGSANVNLLISGNVGIGTTTPSDLLQVAGGSLRVSESGSPANYLKITNISGVSTIDSSNSLGGGSPTLRFVTGQSNGDSFDFLQNMNGNSVVGGMMFTDNAREFGIRAASPGKGMAFFVNGNSAATLSNASMYINSSGNVGIGTTGPTSILETSNSSNAYWKPGSNVWNGLSADVVPPQALTITNTQTGGYDPVLVGRMTTSTGVSKPVFAIGAVGTSGWTNGNLVSQIGDMYFINRDIAGNLQERMRINSSGNVGIGTTSPQQKLHVEGAGAVIQLTDSGASGGTAYFNSKFSATAGLAALQNSGDLVMAPGNAEAVRFKINGNVGIGTTSPLTKLAVAGAAYILGSTTIASLGAGPVYSTSGGGLYIGSAGGSGTVTSVDMSVPTGLAISGNPITTSGTLALSYAAGYAGVLTASTTQWSNLYNNLYTTLNVATTSSSGTFYVSTSSPGNLTINFPNNLLTAVTVDSPLGGSGTSGSHLTCATCVTSVTGSGSILSSGGTTPTVQLQNLTANDILFGQGTNVIGTSTNFTFSGGNTLAVNGTTTVSSFLSVGTTTLWSVLNNNIAPLFIAASSSRATELVIQNPSTNATSSSDFVATSNNGTDSKYFIDMGINNLQNADSNFTIAGANDGFLFTSDGNLTIGTASTTKNLIFFAGGTLVANQIATGTLTGFTFKNATTTGAFADGGLGVCSNGVTSGAGGVLTCNGSAFLTSAVTSVSGSGSILSSGGNTPTVQLQNLTTNDILFGQGNSTIGTSTNFTFTTGTNNLFVTNSSTTNSSIATNLYLSNIASGNCLHTGAGGIVTGTGSDCGSGGSFTPTAGQNIYLTATSSSAGTFNSIPFSTYTVNNTAPIVGTNFHTIQAALDACGTNGGGNIILTDPSYAQGGTGLTFKGSDCNVYGSSASTTISFTGATTLFKTNSAAGKYSNNGVHNLTITGDSNASGVVLNASDMSHAIYENLIIDSIGSCTVLNDTQNITFYNEFKNVQCTTVKSFGINASSTNPVNDNIFTDFFSGCATSGCVSLYMNNGNNNKFYGFKSEPTSATGKIGIRLTDFNGGNGVFDNQFYGSYIEANAVGISISATNGSTGGIKRNIFIGGIIDSNTTDISASSTTGYLQSYIGLDKNFGNPLTSFQGPIGVDNLSASALMDIVDPTFGNTGLNVMNNTGFAENATNLVQFQLLNGSDSANLLNLSNAGTGYTLVATSTTNSFYLTSTGKLSIGSSTPNSDLVVEGSAGQTVPLFTVASSSNVSLFTVTAAGNVGINSSTPSALLTVDSGTAYGTASSTIQVPQKFQLDTYNSAGTRVCLVIVGTTPTVTTGACP